MKLLMLMLISFSLSANDFKSEDETHIIKSFFSNNAIFQGADWQKSLEPTNDISAQCNHYLEASYDGTNFRSRRGQYNLTASQRAALVQDLLVVGRPPERAGTTTMSLNGRTYDVMNDAVTLPDGTYINLTFQESRDLAQAYGCRLPNRSEAQAIRRFAEEGRDGSMVVNARPRTNDSPGMRAMNAMMNDTTLHEYA